METISRTASSPGLGLLIPGCLGWVGVSGCVGETPELTEKKLGSQDQAW